MSKGYLEIGPSRLSARLPLLGPVVGWTRALPDGGILARVWIQLDDFRDELPCGALYTLWNPHTRAVRPGSQQLVRLVRLRTDKAGLPALQMYFAVADVAIPVDARDCVLRVMSLHLRPDPARAQPVSFPAVELGPWFLEVIASSASGKSVTKTADAREWLKAALQSVRFEELYGVGLTATVDELTNAILSQVESDLDGERRRRDAPHAETGSRARLYARDMSECEVRLAPAAWTQLASPSDALTFAAACCRHPGTGFEHTRSGRTLAALAHQAQDPAGPAFALFVGDQIYADATAGVLDVTDRFEKYSSRYAKAYDATAFRECATSLPLYMVADDHEIDNDWSNSQLDAPLYAPAEQAQGRELLSWAALTFKAYQRLHGPTEPSILQNWYVFEAPPAHFFVMDTRFERWAPAPHVATPRICSTRQYDELLAWLENLKEDPAPKFIVSGSVFAPGLAAYRDDPATAPRAENWQAFAAQRAKLLSHIIDLRVNNVVFLSGDYHCAAVGALRLRDKLGAEIPDLHAYAIVAPPLYAPYPFANARRQDLCAHEVIADPRDPGRPLATCTARACEGDGFAQIGVRRDPEWSIEVALCAAAEDSDRTIASRPYSRARLAGGGISF